MAERANVEIKLDLSGFVEAAKSLAAAIEHALDPWQGVMLRMVYATHRGEVPCGLPHGELDGPCRRCRAVL